MGPENDTSDCMVETTADLAEVGICHRGGDPPRVLSGGLGVHPWPRK